MPVGLTPTAEARVAAATDRLAPIVVPAGLAVVTWLALLLAAGILFRADGLSVFVPLFFVAILLWPVYSAAPWREGASDRAREWLQNDWPALAVAAGLGVLPVLPAVPDLLVSILQLPYRGSGLFFGATLVYRQRFDPLAGRVLLRFGQWTIQLLWLYLLATLVVGAARRLR